MLTSYYGSKKIKNIDKDRLVSVSYIRPEGFLSIRRYVPLCPSWKLVNAYKTGLITKEEYTKQYYEDVLNKLDPDEVYTSLGENSILLCYEKSGDFCHRRIIADWFKETIGQIVEEL